ncbi:globin domain-containing protein [Streptacidiphilus sp. ASG 303]|uniref:globin domain-containing protein n=1 Tax=Streptacidiphilus sp. ASG 303 TaxID=2896847 RepID=UPI001E656CA5|nr:globin domain-containing protein [Streptacidiphilus sp. ASG 303]MCD0481800.1 globin domain-containing protein [Streptacidiphilus sp. ASG 303]
MLSAESTPVVRATLPAVGAAIDEIAARFYQRLFAAHPELLRDLFNRGNQANGEQRRALAGSIAAFAGMLLDRPDERPDALLSRIAHKHASLGVTSAQYKVVHTHLLAAVAEVLGDAVTPEVAAAWDEVYWLMANALIAVEAELYQRAGAPEGDVWRRMRVVGRTQETADTASFVVRPEDGSAAGGFRPGQYVSVQVELPDGAHQIRQYSLSAAPGRADWRITVKRVLGGDAPEGEVSSWLHGHVRTGDVLRVSAPFGDLVLPDGDGPLLLVSAGVGCTPMLSMLDHLAATGSARPVTVVHADRSPAAHAHLAELRERVAGLPGAALLRWYEEPGDEAGPDVRAGLVDVDALELPEGVTAYLCGPLPFLRAVRGGLLRRGVPAADVHYEVFGPDLWLGRD